MNLICWKSVTCVRHDAHLPLFFCWQEKPRVDVRKFVKIGRPGYKGTTVSLILRLSPCMTLSIVQVTESWAGPGNKATAHMTLFYLMQLRNREIRTVDNIACFSRWVESWVTVVHPLWVIPGFTHSLILRQKFCGLGTGQSRDSQ